MSHRIVVLIGFLVLGCAACTERVPTSPDCAFEVSPLAGTHGPAGIAEQTITVTAPARCEWTVSGDASWVSFSPTSSAGDGVVRYAVQPNAGVRRTATLRIGNRTFSIVQAGSDSYTVAPTAVSVGSLGGQPNPITVTAATGLMWTATSSAAWLTITAGGSGSGDGTISFRVDANAAATQRSGTITVANPATTVATVTVTQAARVPQPSPYDGQWVGSGTGTSTRSTPARVDLSFDVLDGVITRMFFEFSIDTVPGTPDQTNCGGNSTYTNTRINGSAFSISGGIVYPTTLSGTFTSATSASGTAQMVPGTVTETRPWCLGATVSWRATKR